MLFYFEMVNLIIFVILLLCKGDGVPPRVLYTCTSVCVCVCTGGRIKTTTASCVCNKVDVDSIRGVLGKHPRSRGYMDFSYC